VSFDGQHPNRKPMKHANTMKRPELRTIPLQAAIPRPGTMMITCAPGQWDTMLAQAYDRGWILLEIAGEKPRRAYQKCMCASHPPSAPDKRSGQDFSKP